MPKHHQHARRGERCPTYCTTNSRHARYTQHAQRHVQPQEATPRTRPASQPPLRPPTTIYGYATGPWISVPARTVKCTPSNNPTPGASQRRCRRPAPTQRFGHFVPRRCTATSPTDDASTAPAPATAEVTQGRSCPGSPIALGHGPKAHKGN